jgi:hypothetical protein
VRIERMAEDGRYELGAASSVPLESAG